MITNFNATPGIDTLAHFKEWAKGISDGIRAAGWTQASDTGQVDWTAIGAVPGSGATVYEIWHMADSLQSTMPVFLRMDYGNTAGSLLKIGVQIGTATDGAGGITGNLSDAISANQDIASKQYACFVAGDTNRLTVAMMIDANVDDNSIPWAFQIERSHAADGSDTDEYVTLVGVITGNFQQSVFKPSTGTQTAKETKTCCFVPVTAASGTYNSSTWFCPLFPFVGQQGNPMIAGCVKAADTNDLAAFTVKMYGVNHQLMAMKAGPFASMAVNNNGAFCFRYE